MLQEVFQVFALVLQRWRASSIYKIVIRIRRDKMKLQHKN
jgi:hypothetical protein